MLHLELRARMLRNKRGGPSGVRRGKCLFLSISDLGGAKTRRTCHVHDPERTRLGQSVLLFAVVCVRSYQKSRKYIVS